jgi:hypothetical protein
LQQVAVVVEDSEAARTTAILVVVVVHRSHVRVVKSSEPTPRATRTAVEAPRRVYCKGKRNVRRGIAVVVLVVLLSTPIVVAVTTATVVVVVVTLGRGLRSRGSCLLSGYSS